MDITQSPTKPKLFDELSLSDSSSEFMDVEEETSLRKRLFPAPILSEVDVLNPVLVCSLLNILYLICIHQL